MSEPWGGGPYSHILDEIGRRICAKLLIFFGGGRYQNTCMHKKLLDELLGSLETFYPKTPMCLHYMLYVLCSRILKIYHTSIDF